MSSSISNITDYCKNMNFYKKQMRKGNFDNILSIYVDKYTAFNGNNTENKDDFEVGNSYNNNFEDGLP
jgi:hypothetical protein